MKRCVISYMDDTGFYFLVLNICLYISWSKQHFIPENPAIKRFIHENRLLQEGFEKFDLANIQVIEDNHSVHSILKRRRRSSTNTTSLFTSFTSFGEKFTFELKQSKLFDSSSKVLIRNGSHMEEWHYTDPDCYLYGELTLHRGSASLHYCDGLTGAFTANGSHYRIDTIKDADGVADRQLISKLDQKKRESKDFGCTGEHDSQSLKTKPSNRQRLRRGTGSTVATIEVAVYVDAYTTNKLNESGLTTTEQKVKALLIKWNGVQAEYSKIDQLGQEIKIEIKLIEFWTVDPDWLTVGTASLTDTLNAFNNGINSISDALPYDLHFLYCLDNDEVKDGYAWPSSVCKTNNYAVAKMGGVLSFSLTTHEVGHTLGMKHDVDQNSCVSPDVGLMQTNGGLGYDWSSCSRSEMETFLQTNPACMFRKDINSDDVPAELVGSTLSPLWPGIEYDPDELCEQKAGAGFEFRAFPYDWGVCDLHSCIDMNPGTSYGHMINFNPNAYGTYCGEGMMCMQSNCKPKEESGLPASALAVVEGGWGEWGSFTECSRTCGTGLRIRTRKCDNPRPRNTECEGLDFDADKCSTEPCSGDSADKTTLINQRATETCSWLLENGMLQPDEYTASGIAFWDTRIGQCEVWCAPVEGFDYPNNIRHGLMPDGTPCSQDTYTLTDNEKLGFPRSRGVSGHCVLGYCEAFGCDDKPGGRIFDECGVCDGDGTTCTTQEGVYTTVVASGERDVIITLPVGAYRIQFYTDYLTMQDNYLEVWSADEDALLAPYITYEFDTRSEPKPAAGTTWTFYWYHQYLYASDPITEPVVIKLHNYGSNDNTGVTYAYSIPLETTLTSASSTPSTVTSSTAMSTTTSIGPTSTDSTSSQTTTKGSTQTSPDTSTASTKETAASSTSSLKTTTSDYVSMSKTSGIATNMSASSTNSSSPSTSFSTSAPTSPVGTTSTSQTTTTTVRLAPNADCVGGAIQCYDGTCISYKNICDGVKDCAQNEDEEYISCKLYGRSGALPSKSSMMIITGLFIISLASYYTSRV